MAVLCPVCQAYSSDYRVCEHCQADLRTVSVTRPPDQCSLGGGALVLNDEQRDRLSDPDQSILVTNGDRWLLIRDTESGDMVVRHEPNLASGGQASEIEVDAFLTRTGHAPQALALRRMLERS